MTRLMTGSDHQEIAIITDTFRSSSDQAVFLPTENKILETALAISYYFSRNNICAAEYHLQQELVRLTVENTWKFEEFYNSISGVMFNSQNTHRMLYEEALRRQDILDSSMAFLIMSAWDAETDMLLSELERNNMSVVICFIGDNENDIPDLSNHKSSSLINISPYRDLIKELGE